MPFEIEPEVGPIVHHPIRDKRGRRGACGWSRPRRPPPTCWRPSACSAASCGGRAALIGFSGAPFTLACYMIEGRPSRDYAHAKALMYGDEATWHRLMETVTEVTIRYLRAQVAAGVAGGAALRLLGGRPGPARVRRPRAALHPAHLRGRAGHRGAGHPLRHRHRRPAGADDRRRPRRGQRGLAGAPGRGLGADRLRQGHPGQPRPGRCWPWPRFEEGVREADRAGRAGGRPGHIFNLGHGVLPDTDPEQLARLAEHVHHGAPRGRLVPTPGDAPGRPPWASC